MENLNILERFINPDLMQNMSIGERLLASSYVAALGMCTTFAVLIILWGLIVVMAKVLSTMQPKRQTVNISSESALQDASEDKELIAVITAAVAASLNRPVGYSRIKNISRIR
ncbi:OadG family protein [Wukongibacter baidiensis]|uniref:OadG family protein n=1 Tax=Wukongibacter baidiensis TaxID=1723361 RepID=UPI003D7F8267